MHGTQTLEHLDTSLPPPGELEQVQAPPTEPGRRKKWPILAVAGAVVLAMGVGVVGGRISQQSEIDDLTEERDTLSSDITDLDGERDRLTANIVDLEAAAESDAATIAELMSDLGTEESRNTALEQERAVLTTDLAAEREQVSSLSTANTELRTTIEDARDVAVAIAYLQLNFDSSALEEWKSFGYDLTLLEAMLGHLGHDTTIDEWAASWDDWDGAWQQADSAVRDTGDDVLIEAWHRFNNAEYPSDEWSIAGDDLWMRTSNLLLERLPNLD